MEMIVKEKEFRNSMSQIDFTYFKGEGCSYSLLSRCYYPALVYMVLAEKFHDNAVSFDFKDIASVEEDLWKENLLKADISSFTGHKSCGKGKTGYTACTLYAGYEPPETFGKKR